jgi:hypothetical protein
MGPHLIILGMVVAQLADATSFVVAVTRFGITHEANGIAAALYHLGGLDAVLIAKGAVIVVAIMILVLAAHRFRRVLVMGGAAATSLGLLGFITNTWSMAILGG